MKIYWYHARLQRKGVGRDQIAMLKARGLAIVTQGWEQEPLWQ